MKPISKINENVLACSYMGLSMFCFVANDALIRKVGSTVPVGQILLLRNGILVLLLLLALRQLGQWQTLPAVFAPKVAVRAIIELFGTFAFLYALMRIPFANTAAILQCLPLAVTLGASLFFGEKVGPWRWSAIVVGFIGVVIVLRPGMAGFAPAALWLLVTVVCGAARDLLSRSIPNTVPTSIISLSTAAIIAIAGLFVVLWQGNWVALGPIDMLLLMLSAVFLLGAYQFIVMSMRIGDVGFVAPFRYTSLLGQCFWGGWSSMNCRIP